MEMATATNEANVESESPPSLRRFNLRPIAPKVQQTWFGKVSF